MEILAYRGLWLDCLECVWYSERFFNGHFKKPKQVAIVKNYCLGSCKASGTNIDGVLPEDSRTCCRGDFIVPFI